MATYKTVSCKTVIAKVYRDLRIADANRELDMLEWIGEALDFIGSGVTFEQKGATLQIVSHKAPLPNDLVSLTQVKYKKEFHSFHTPLRYNPKAFPDAIHEVDSPDWVGLHTDTYTLNSDYLLTDFEDGEVLLSYIGIKTDEDGYPVIPDDPYFKEAMFWYIFKQLLLGGYSHHVNIDYQLADDKWRYFAMNAKNQAKYPDIGEYQRFADVWVGLIPHQRLFEDGFSLEDREFPARELVNASNLVTKPLTVDPPEEE